MLSSLVWEGLLYLLDRVAIDIHHGDGEKKAHEIETHWKIIAVFCVAMSYHLWSLRVKNMVRSCDVPV